MTDDTKLPLTSADLTAALLAQLRQTSPQIFSEGRLQLGEVHAAFAENLR